MINQIVRTEEVCDPSLYGHFYANIEGKDEESSFEEDLIHALLILEDNVKSFLEDEFSLRELIMILYQYHQDFENILAIMENNYLDELYNKLCNKLLLDRFINYGLNFEETLKKLYEKLVDFIFNLNYDKKESQIDFENKIDQFINENWEVQDEESRLLLKEELKNLL